MQRGFKWVNLNDRDHLEFLGLRCRILLEQILIKCDEMAWIRLDSSTRPVQKVKIHHV